MTNITAFNITGVKRAWYNNLPNSSCAFYVEIIFIVATLILIFTVECFAFVALWLCLSVVVIVITTDFISFLLLILFSLFYLNNVTQC